MDSSQFYCGSSSGDAGEAIEGGGSGSGSPSRSREFEILSLEISRRPRELLQTFLAPRGLTLSNIQQSRGGKGEECEEEVELNLGLSLGGKFGVDKSHRGLTRSSSVAGSIPLIRGDDAVAPAPSVVPGLVRTSSLPTETEEQLRKRKELQTLRRLEAKRRRSEKQRSARESGEDLLNLNFRGKSEKEIRCVGGGKKVSSSSVAVPFSLPKGGGSDAGVKGRGGFFTSLQGLLAQQGSQGSGESQGGSPSGASELENKPVQEGGGCGARSSGSSHSLQGGGSQEGCSSPATKCESRRGSEMDSLSKQPEMAEKKKRETRPSSNTMEDMRSVFTIGDGPNGRKVDGILYRYGKGEEVLIMCICHGNFFSPAEFVKHAGGRDVEHPLRHIVVNPSSSPY